MKSISKWMCTNSTKNLFVKIVYPGGRVELHDRPILAAELLNRNPKSCVAHPTVFQQPYAILSPTTILTLGQKYYVVPVGTVRKLQLKYCASKSNLRINDHKKEGDHDDQMEYACWLMKNNKKCDQNVENGGKRVSVSTFDHWQPGLESISEE